MSVRFVAYPASPPDIGATIRAALEILRSDFRREDYSGWEESDIAGRFIADPILNEIADGDLLVADVTRLSFNVTYEIGYAIGRRKRAFLIRNTAIINEDVIAREVGIYDTLGYEPYSNSRQLAVLLNGVSDVVPLASAEREPSDSPVYVVLPKIKADADIRLISRIKKSRLQFRSFDAEEQGRLSGISAINSVSISHGVIAPLLPSDRTEARVHNLRAAFVAGLAAGMDKELLLLQYGDDPIPIDYRDLVHPAKTEGQIEDAIAEFAPAVTARLQARRPRVIAEAESFLTKLHLGASSAENEMGDLPDYYLETEEYRRVSRGESQIVTGRKGSGKTALFVRLRDSIRRTRQTVILDLRPEGFQLLKFKDVILAHMEQGTKEHTITAFWEYLLLLEICHKILEKDREVHVTNHKLFQPYKDLAEQYQGDPYVSEGDFSERMLKLTQRIISEMRDVIGPEGWKSRLNSQELTNLLYKHDTKLLRERIAGYLEAKRGLWILFDNLDKGWAPSGIGADDVLIVRALLEAISKLERHLRKKEIDCHGVVFLRNDVYEILLNHTADRGKVGRVIVDWTDPELLRELLRKRFIANNLDPKTSFDSIWQQMCVSHVGSEESSAYIIDRCLMRPRALIDFLQYCRSHAINLGHTRIELDDIREGEAQYSNDMIENVGFEIRDVFPAGRDVLYEFVGTTKRLSGAEVREIIGKAGIAPESHDELLELLLWYGFLGVVRDDGEVAYIYSVRYDMKRLKALAKFGSGVAAASVFQVNPAFWIGLEIKIA